MNADTPTKSYTPLDEETRSGVETDCAAHHLNRKPQTLRTWACYGTGPIKPQRINGRFLWSTARLRELQANGDGQPPKLSKRRTKATTTEAV